MYLHYSLPHTYGHLHILPNLHPPPPPRYYVMLHLVLCRVMQWSGHKITLTRVIQPIYVLSMHT